MHTNFEWILNCPPHITLPETNIAHDNPIFPGLFPSKRWIFQPAMLVYRSVLVWHFPPWISPLENAPSCMTLLDPFGPGTSRFLIGFWVWFTKLKSWFTVDMREKILVNCTGWLVLNLHLVATICSSFSRENGHIFLICSSLSTAQLIWERNFWWIAVVYIGSTPHPVTVANEGL